MLRHVLNKVFPQPSYLALALAVGGSSIATVIITDNTHHSVSIYPGSARVASGRLCSIAQGVKRRREPLGQSEEQTCPVRKVHLVDRSLERHNSAHREYIGNGPSPLEQREWTSPHFRLSSEIGSSLLCSVGGSFEGVALTVYRI